MDKQKTNKLMPEMGLSDFENLIYKLGSPDMKISTKRKLLQQLEQSKQSMPEQFEGEIYNRCFTILTSKTETISVRVYAMGCAYQIAQKHLDLLKEFIVIVENINSYSKSPALISRSRSILFKNNKR